VKIRFDFVAIDFYIGAKNGPKKSVKNQTNSKPMGHSFKTDLLVSDKPNSMANKTIYRMAPVKARVGVDTRKKVNSVVPRGAFRGDNLSVEKITGLGHPAVINWGTDSRSWGDIVLNFTQPTPVEVQRKEVDVEYELYCDMVAEPWKYGDCIGDWLELDVKLRNSEKVKAFWAQKEAKEAKELAQAQAVWRKAFKPIAKQCAERAATISIWKYVLAYKARRNTAVKKIQALVRGQQVRKSTRPKCCYCSASCDGNFCNVECRVLFDRECW
jgi:hypothetical protein